MKKFVFICLISVIWLSFMEPAEFKWYSLQEGLELARRENKPVLLFVYVSWCDKCQRMDKKIFTNKAVLSLITQNFITIKINPEVDTACFHNDKLIDRKLFLNEIEPGKLAISVPTTVLYREKEHVTLNGLIDPEDLKSDILKFLKKE